MPIDVGYPTLSYGHITISAIREQASKLTNNCMCVQIAIHKVHLY